MSDLKCTTQCYTISYTISVRNQTAVNMNRWPDAAPRVPTNTNHLGSSVLSLWRQIVSEKALWRQEKNAVCFLFFSLSLTLSVAFCHCTGHGVKDGVGVNVVMQISSPRRPFNRSPSLTFTRTRISYYTLIFNSSCIRVVFYTVIVSHFLTSAKALRCWIF